MTRGEGGVEEGEEEVNGDVFSMQRRCKEEQISAKQLDREDALDLLSPVYSTAYIYTHTYTQIHTHTYTHTY